MHPNEAGNLIHPINLPSTVSNGRRTLSNGLVITIPPGGRWPERFSFEHNLKDMNTGQRAAWIAKPQPTLIATAWRPKYANNATLAASLLGLIRRIITAPDVKVSTPFRSDNAEHDADRTLGPFNLLISGAGTEGTAILLDLGTVATEGAVFFFKPFETPNSHYIGTLEGLMIPPGDQGAEQVKQIVKVCLQECNHAMDFIRTWTPNAIEDEANRVVASITVESLDIRSREGEYTQYHNCHHQPNSVLGSTITVWNIYCSPPPIPHHIYQGWLNIVRALNPSDYDAGRGSFRSERQFLCAGCRSVNHPTGLCPFPLIEGWLGPAPNTDLPEDAVTNQPAQPTNNTNRGRNRSGRGRPTRGNANRGRPRRN